MCIGARDQQVSAVRRWPTCEVNKSGGCVLNKLRSDIDGEESEAWPYAANHEKAAEWKATATLE